MLPQYNNVCPIKVGRKPKAKINRVAKNKYINHIMGPFRMVPILIKLQNVIYINNIIIDLSLVLYSFP